MAWFKRIRSGIKGSVEKPAPIIESPYERGFEREFRRPGDSPHVIRINQHPPKGLPRKLAEYVEVAGISRDEARINAERFIAGTNRRIELERDPTNTFDPNAIKVIGIWTDADGGEHRSRIGWVPREIAKNIAENYPHSSIGATLETIYKPHNGKGAGIRIDIWCPKATKAKKD